jgi:hypothetical protein
MYLRRAQRVLGLHMRSWRATNKAAGAAGAAGLSGTTGAASAIGLAGEAFVPEAGAGDGCVCACGRGRVLLYALLCTLTFHFHIFFIANASPPMHHRRCITVNVQVLVLLRQLRLLGLLRVTAGDLHCRVRFPCREAVQSITAGCATKRTES